MIMLRLKASQNLISLVENTGTGENLPVGKKVKFEPWTYLPFQVLSARHGTRFTLIMQLSSPLTSLSRSSLLGTVPDLLWSSSSRLHCSRKFMSSAWTSGGSPSSRSPTSFSSSTRPSKLGIPMSGSCKSNTKLESQYLVPACQLIKWMLVNY